MEPEPSTIRNIKDPHHFLFNIVSSCLLKEIRFYDKSDERRSLILDSLENMAGLDPEFILQLAYYLRKKLYIRTTTNFILAFATFHPKTQPFVIKYFAKSVLLPTDLLEIVQFFQMIRLIKKQPNLIDNVSSLNNFDFRKRIFLSKPLRKAAQERLKDFSIYQLGKYCSDNKRKAMLVKYKLALEEKTPKRRKKNLEKSKKQEEEQKSNTKKILKKGIKKAKYAKAKLPTLYHTSQLGFISMKDLIRVGHFKAPIINILSILGKRYPATAEEFIQLIGANAGVQFDASKAGKKMKLPVPKTWETELSLKGNTAETWTGLIQTDSLPYMAMMRNLRNILKAGVDDEAHMKVIGRIQKEELVKNAKMFPFQYFSALEAVNKVEMNQEIKQKYLESVEKAISLSVDLNLETITGRTVVFADVSGSMSTPVSGRGSKKSYGSIRTCKEIALLLGLLIRSKCEHCLYFIFSSPSNNGKCYLEVSLKGNNLLENMKILEEKATQLGGGTDFPYECIEEITQKKSTC